MSGPETLREAQEWESTKRHYLRDGLCQRCAAQAANGHQIGFRLSHAPCANCAVIVASFPLACSHPSWRKRSRDARRAGRYPTPGEAQGGAESLPVAAEGVV